MSKPQFKFSISYDFQNGGNPLKNCGRGFKVKPKVGTLRDIFNLIQHESFQFNDIEIWFYRSTIDQKIYYYFLGFTHHFKGRGLCFKIEGREGHLKRIATMLNNGSL